MLEIRNLRKFTLEGVDLAIERGQIVTLLGRSGSGKSTLLRCVAGIERPDGGSIHLADREVEGPGIFEPPERRGVGLVFQNFALFPHLTVEANIRFGLREWPTEEQRRRLAEQLALHRIEGLEHRYPHQISGGQQQRVALARALAPGPELLLLDEPFSNLDEQVRHDLRIELRDIFKAQGMTAIIVSHASNDAVATSDAIAFLDHGRIVQLATPAAAYDHPRTAFVAAYLGRTNLLPARRAGAVWETAAGAVSAVLSGEGGGTLSVRPEWIRARRTDGAKADGVVERVETFGAQSYGQIRLPKGLAIWVNLAFDRSWQGGEAVALSIHAPAPLAVLEEESHPAA